MTIQEPYILLIDDDDDDIEMLSSELLLLEIKTKTFREPGKAIFYLLLVSDTQELPAMIISDYNMPAIDGMKLLSMLKKNTVTKDIPVIMYSTDISAGLSKLFMEQGAFACYVKPDNFAGFKHQARIFRDHATSFYKCSLG